VNVTTLYRNGRKCKELRGQLLFVFKRDGTVEAKELAWATVASMEYGWRTVVQREEGVTVVTREEA
jgi:hypothetical protein